MSVKAMGVKFGAVDIIETNNGKLQVLEVNSLPGFYHFIKVYGKDNFNLLLEKLISDTIRTKKEQSVEQLEATVEETPLK
jgi:glutathione synthase/RimK-type ligase-like ATP-grasp enzyme